MAPRPSRFLLLTACVLFSAGSALAQRPPKDTGKKLLPKLFAEAVSAAGESTLRIKSDGKDVALGTVVASDGYVLSKGSELLNPQGTEPRGELTCSFRDGTVYDAKLLGYHKASDLALLKIDAEGLRPIKFADADDVAVGNWVATTGIGSEPVAIGVVSVGPRKLTGEQTVIVNANKGYFGVQPKNNPDGDGPAVVGALEENGAAKKAGMKRGDVISEVGGKTIKDWSDLLAAMEGYRPHDNVVVRVKRADDEDKAQVREVKLQVRLGSRGDFDRGAMQNTMGSSLSGRRTGFPKVIQHDTVIKPTDCGGPVVDLDGHVLGLNIARAGRVETWALPGSVVEPILKDLKAGKYSLVNK